MAVRLAVAAFEEDVAVLVAEMRDVDRCHGVAGEHGEPLPRLHRRKPLARSEDGERTGKADRIELRYLVWNRPSFTLS